MAVRAFDVKVPISLSVSVVFWGVGGALALIVWNLMVEESFALAKGRHFSDQLRESLSSHFIDATPPQLVGALGAAAGEEILFRGFIQTKWGLLAGSVAFMLGHFGRKDIRLVSYFSLLQGVALGLIYSWSGSLLSPMLAHGLYDASAMAYFLRRHRTESVDQKGPLS